MKSFLPDIPYGGEYYSARQMSMLWLHITWRCKAPWDRQTWYWSCREKGMASKRADFSYLYHFYMEEWYKMQMPPYVSYEYQVCTLRAKGFNSYNFKWQWTFERLYIAHVKYGLCWWYLLVNGACHGAVMFYVWNQAPASSHGQTNSRSVSGLLPAG